MKRLFLSLIILALIGCSRDITIEETIEIMPPEYKILCSVEDNKYTLWLPYKKEIAVAVWDSKERAAAFAVYLEKHRNDPFVQESDKYTWGECQE